MKRVTTGLLLLSVLFLTVLAGCRLLPGRNPDPGEKGEGEVVPVPVEEVDRALETALARGGKFI